MMREMEATFVENGELYEAIQGLSLNSATFLSNETLQPLPRLGLGVTIATQEELTVAKAFISRTVISGLELDVHIREVLEI